MLPVVRLAVLLVEAPTSGVLLGVESQERDVLPHVKDCKWLVSFWKVGFKVFQKAIQSDEQAVRIMGNPFLFTVLAAKEL
jgi:hypothetical protein